MVKPITPKEALKLKASTFPDGVIEAFNEVIAKNLDQGYSTFKQKEVLKAIALKMGATQDATCENGWLDVEDIYRKAGWVVEYDKPAYNESYDATFTFSTK